MAQTARLTTALADRYRIERELGQGGMATVYLAEDLKHDRKVALKVLRPELAAVIGAERFLHEIKVTANLQHPHILPLHDSGEADSFLYYVMPYVEGESLRDLLNREKQLGVDEAIEITRAVAGALDYAHRQGVIHRDIKPENILLHEGQPMIADFGIALALSHAGGNRLTETGLSIGTPQYMSPEQAMGDRELDARSDVYSLAAVLYELLTGEPPYTGATAQAIVARVITEDPRPLMLQRSTVPPHVAASVHKALSKLPADRFHSAAEFSEALVKPGMVSMPVTVQGPAAAPGAGTRGPRALAWPAAAGAALLLAAIGWFRPGPAAPAPVRWHLSPPDLAGTQYGPSFALSPEGRLLAYRVQGAAGARYRVRDLSQLGYTDLTGTEDAAAPFFSPDGRHLAFFGDDNIRRVPVTGGPAVTVADSAVGGGAWGSDGYIYFTHVGFGLARVPEDGGAAEVLTIPDTTADRAVAGHLWPDVLPEANGVILTAIRLPLGNSRIAVLDLATGQLRELFGGTYARYAASGHLVYARADGALLAVPFDADRLEVTGSPIALAEGVPIKIFGDAEVALAQNGTLLYGVGTGESGIAVLDTAGRERLYPTTEGAILYPRSSPDGRRVALEVAGQGADIWVYQFRDSTMTRLTFDGLNNYPEWTPDGGSVTWSRAPGAGVDRNIFIKPADGAAPERVLFDLPQSQVEAVWLPDGQGVVVRQGDRGRGQNASIAAVPLGGGEPEILLETRFQERAPTVSPDGRWLAYVSNESGRDEVYVRPYPGPGGRWQASSGGGTEPRWAHSGRELFYRRSNDLVAVAVTGRSTFSLGQRRRVLDAGAYQVNPNHAAWDVLPGDTGFVFIRTQSSSNELVVVQHWFEELRARTAANR